MKFRMNLPQFLQKKNKLGQKGQSLVEFVLLLAVISSISYGFVSLINTNLVNNWEKYINLVITDKANTIEYPIQ